MSTCDELRPNAAGIASLPQGDPEREEYLLHARGCDACMRALGEGAKLMRLIEASPVPAPSREALQRASAAIASELRESSRLQAPARPKWIWPAAAAAVAAFCVPLLLSQHLELEGLGAALVVLFAATLLAGAAGALRAGALVTLAASAGFALAAGGVPVALLATSVRTGGIDCMFNELVAAALPLLATAWMFQRRPFPGALATAAAAGALAGQAALHIGCSGSHNAAHLWVFHVGGVAAAALLGWVVEGQLTRAPS